MFILKFRYIEYQPKLSKCLRHKVYTFLSSSIGIFHEFPLFVLIHSTAVNSSRRALEVIMDEDTNMLGIYRFMFTISQLGGLWAFFIIVLGLVLRHVYDKCFQYDILNELNRINNESLAKLQEESLAYKRGAERSELHIPGRHIHTQYPFIQNNLKLKLTIKIWFLKRVRTIGLHSLVNLKKGTSKEARK